MPADAGKEGQAAIDANAELDAIVQKAVYTEADKAPLIELDKIYRFSALNTPGKPLLVLVKVRGQLYSRGKSGKVTVKANGVGDWTGWFALVRDDVRWTATYNTARVIAETKPDILICIEAEDRQTLLRFNEDVLGGEFEHEFPHVMLVDGNDSRGIDVAS